VSLNNPSESTSETGSGQITSAAPLAPADGAPDATSEDRSWWARPCGGREVLRVALPLVASTVSYSLMNLIDRMLLLWYDADACAAALPAGALMFSLICLPLGVAAYANTFVAQYIGAQQSRSVGNAIWQAVLWSLAVTPLFLLAIPFASDIFRWVAHTPDVTKLEVVYFQTLAYGAGGHLLAASLSSFYSGRGKTQVVMTVDCLAALLNVVLDYLLIFGEYGFPELGMQGAAIATNICLWSRAAAYWILMRQGSESEFGLRSGRYWNRKLFGRLLYFGGPDGFRMAVEMTAVTCFVFLVGRLGDNELAATTIAFNINGVGFMPLLGLSIAVATLVGQQLGAGRPDLASRATATALAIGLGYTVVTAVAYLSVPELILSGHRAGANPEQYAALQETTIALLRFVAAYCVIDVFYMVLLGTIKGAGDTRFVLISTIALSPMPVVIVWLGQRYADWNLYHCWWVLTAWILANGLVYAFRVWQGKWKSLRVIEEVPIELV
jgi:MATE family multidrug resistance protein